MAWRVTERQVYDTIEVENADGAIDPRIKRTLAEAIDAGNALTDKVSALDTDSTLNDALLTQIEKYLSAWFAEAFGANQQPSSKSTEGASATFQGQSGMRLEDNKFGQRALVLDVSGGLARLQSGVHTVEATWLGKAPSEQTDYEDRD